MAEAEVGLCWFSVDFQAPNPHRVTRTMWNERVLTADFRLISSWVHPNQRGFATSSKGDLSTIIRLPNLGCRVGRIISQTPQVYTTFAITYSQFQPWISSSIDLDPTCYVWPYQPAPVRPRQVVSIEQQRTGVAKHFTSWTTQYSNNQQQNTSLDNRINKKQQQNSSSSLLPIGRFPSTAAAKRSSSHMLDNSTSR
ncbi:hypothetical protein RHGRI_020825 [Rhododendron griersonianum]|uniref:DUF4283 domain-containing protein n=1 Tax=Rhododendron griersonianum TaxID=479676 RepID=A0AAV6JL61_9ERIC|nr:hypothetical protein RHGRI_020825 [Rhododendron griersonianum]